MIADVQQEGAKVGLQLHPDKTKIQHNNIGYGSRARSAKVNDMNIEVLESTASSMYLGRALCLLNVHDVEFVHRLKRAWAKFGAYRDELTDKMVPLHLRLKLFHSVVTPSVLYGCSSWVMTRAKETQLQSVQMKMMRSILGKGRATNTHGVMETWVEWVQRVTHEARVKMEHFKIPNWTDEVQVRLCRWHEKLGSMSQERWARKVFAWDPSGYRLRGRPLARWADQPQLSPMGM